MPLFITVLGFGYWLVDPTQFIIIVILIGFHHINILRTAFIPVLRTEFALARPLDR